MSYARIPSLGASAGAATQSENYDAAMEAWAAEFQAHASAYMTAAERIAFETGGWATEFLHGGPWLRLLTDYQKVAVASGRALATPQDEAFFKEKLFGGSILFSDHAQNALLAGIRETLPNQPGYIQAPATEAPPGAPDPRGWAAELGDRVFGLGKTVIIISTVAVLAYFLLPGFLGKGVREARKLRRT